MKIAKTNKCPRCYLPQNGIYECQYCGYDLDTYNKKHSTIIRKKLNNIIGGFKKVQVVSTDKKSKVHFMNNTSKTLKRKNNREKRSGSDRRKYKFITYIPERRSDVDRRE